MTIPRSGDDRKEWAAAVSRYVRALIAAGYSGITLSDAIRKAKHLPTGEIAALALAVEQEDEGGGP